MTHVYICTQYERERHSGHIERDTSEPPPDSAVAEGDIAARERERHSLAKRSPPDA